jgi:hypothetical protein
MRGRKAATEHVCNKPEEKFGKWIVKEDQHLILEKPKNRDSWVEIMSQKVIVECTNCKSIKYCLLEKLNKAHFIGTKYDLPDNFWDKSSDILSLPIESEKKKEERKIRIEKTAEILASKAAKLKRKASTIEVSSSEE